MTELLAAATIEEFMGSFRVLWCVQVLIHVLLLVAVILMAKGGEIGAKLLMVGLAWLVMGGLMECATRYDWLAVGYSPSYASVRREYEMGGPDWERWEPLFWWARFLLRCLGAVAVGVGFVLAGRRMAADALRRDLEGNQAEVQESHGD